MSFEHTARCDIPSGPSESPASQEPPELEAPAIVASASYVAIRKLLRSPDTIGFRYPPPIPPSGSHGTLRDCTTIPGPKANFVVFVILQIMPKRPTNENQARKVTQTPLH